VCYNWEVVLWKKNMDVIERAYTRIDVSLS
jgi:hypothetical protein